MNVLQIISKLDTSDGAEDVISSTRFMTLNGHKVIVVSQRSALVKKIDEVGARYYAIPLKPNIFLIPMAIFMLSQLVLKENIQVVHARDSLSSFIAFFASRFTERPFVTTVYEYHRMNFFKRSQFWAKRIICFSESDVCNLVKMGLVPQGRIAVIPPFVSVDEFRPQGGEFSVMGPEYREYFVIGARLPLFSAEATQSFIKTVSVLSRTIHKIKVFIINSAPRCEKDSVEKLELLIRRHSLSNIVMFLPERWQRALGFRLDLFVQVNIDPFRKYFSNRMSEIPSARDFLQAQAWGIPVMMTYADWIKDYVKDNRTAVVCKGMDPQEMVPKILDLYRNKNLQQEMVSVAKNFVVEKFNAKKIMESTLAFYEEVSMSMNILIIKIGALGDVILIIPSVRAIREKFPKAKIKLLVGIGNREVFINSPFIDEIIPCDFKERDRGLKGLLRIAKRLRAETFDIVIDLQNNKRSHLLSFLSCAPKRYGYDNGKLSFLLNKRVKDTKLPLGPIEHQSRVLGLLGLYDIDKRLELWPSKEDEEWADNFLRSHWAGPALLDEKIETNDIISSGIKRDTKLAALNIGSSPRWATKLWPVKYYIEVCDKLAKNFGIRIVLIGSEESDSRIGEFLKHAKCKPINALGKTNIPRLASLMKRCGVLVSSDSAPIHIAASTGTPFVALFGPTDPQRHLPPARECIVIKKDLKCSPCYHTYCNRGYRCMRSIGPEEVYKAIVELLGMKSEKSEIRNPKFVI